MGDPHCIQLSHCMCVQSRVSLCGKKIVAAYGSKVAIVNRCLPGFEKSLVIAIACSDARTCGVCRTGSLLSHWSDRKSACRSLEKFCAYTICDVLKKKNKNQLFNKDITVVVYSQKRQDLNWIYHNSGLSLVFICVAHILECIPRKRVC